MAKKESLCDQLLDELEEYAKKNTVLKGTVLKNICAPLGTFNVKDVGSKYTFDNYYFNDSIKTLLDTDVFGYFNNVEKYNKIGIKKRGIILEGAVGTGKSTLNYVICNKKNSETTAFWITPETINTNINKAETGFKTIYELASFLSPSIIFLEDIDLYGEDRSISRNTTNLGSLMNILDGVESVENCITIATTNNLGSIEKALRNRPGRFDRVVEIPALDKTMIEKMLKDRLQEYILSDDILKLILTKIADRTGAEVEDFVLTLKLQYLEDNCDKTITTENVEKVLKIIKKHGSHDKQENGFGFNKEDKE